MALSPIRAGIDSLEMGKKQIMKHRLTDNLRVFFNTLASSWFGVNHLWIHAALCCLCLWVRTGMVLLKKALFGFLTLLNESRPFSTPDGTQLPWPALLWLWPVIFLACTPFWIKNSLWLLPALHELGKSAWWQKPPPSCHPVCHTFSQPVVVTTSTGCPLWDSRLCPSSPKVAGCFQQSQWVVHSSSLTFTVALLTFEWEKH